MLGVDVALHVEDRAVADALEVVFAPFRVAEPGGRPLVVWPAAGGFRVTLDGEPFFDPISVEECVAWMIWRLNELVVATPTDRLILHASVASQDGVALVFPGSSGAGKSTLVAGLVRAGMQYLSDELAPIRIGTNLVDPYPRSLTLEEGSWPFFPELERRREAILGQDQWFVPADRLRPGSVDAMSRPIAAIIFPEARPGGATTLDPVPRAQALAELATTAVNLPSRGPAGFQTLALVVEHVDACARLVSGDLDSAVDAVVRLCADLRRQAEHRGRWP
jgi:hypothetical protein